MKRFIISAILLEKSNNFATMFKKGQHTKSLLSGLLAGMYMMLVLFAPSLHQHHSSNNIKLSDVSKTEKQYSKASDSVTANDCLACHFLTTNHSIAPQDFNLTIHDIFIQNKHNFYHVEAVAFQVKYTFPLRGPPAFQV